MKSIANSEETREVRSQEQATRELHLLDLLIVLSGRRRLILCFTLGIGALMAIIVVLLPSQYTALTVVLPPSQNTSIGSGLLAQLGGGSSALALAAGGSFGLKNPSEIYVSMFRLRTVEDAMIQRFGLMNRYHSRRMSEARASFEHHSTVVLGAKDGLIRITVTDIDPKMAADIANGYVDEFRKLSGSLAVTEAAQRRLFFQNQLQEAKGNLTAAEEAMKDTERVTGVLQMDGQTRALIESVALLRGQIAAQEVEIQAMRSYATDDNPQLYAAQQQLDALKMQLAKRTGSPNETGSEMAIRGNVPEVGLEYLRKLRDVRYYQAVEELIAKQFEIAKLDEAKQGATIQVADLAVPPDRRSSPKRTISVLIALAGGFVLICLWCIVSDGLKRFKSNPEQRGRIEELKAILHR